MLLYKEVELPVFFFKFNIKFYAASHIVSVQFVLLAYFIGK